MRKSQIGRIAMLLLVTIALGGCSRVGEDWKAAQAADTTEAYQDFLRQHPDSEFGVPAQERVKQLAEDRDWQLASKADTLDAYQQFVATHADGKWAQEARVRIENFQLSTDGQAPQAVTGTDGKAAAPTVLSGAAAAAAAKPAVKHAAQLGAFSSRSSAEAAWHKLSSRFPAQLKPLQPHYLAARVHSKPVVRLQVSLPSVQRAQELCAALKKQSQACMPVG